MHLDSTPLPVAESTVQFAVADQRSSSAVLACSELSHSTVKKGALAPLGTIAEIAAVSPVGGEGFEAVQSAIPLDKVERYMLQAVVRGLLPHRRVVKCLRHKIPGKKVVEVRYSTERQSPGLGNVQVCGSPWICPPCASNVSEVKRSELEQCLAWARAAGFEVWLLSYTVRHGRSDALCDTLAAFQSAYRSMVGNWAYKALRDRYGLLYTAKALEATFGDGNGWHPHGHLIAVTHPGVNPGCLQADLSDVWLPELRRVGFDATARRGVDVSPALDAVDKYVTKLGRGWCASDELSKGHVKKGRGERLSPFDILRKYREGREPKHAKLYREFDEAFHHKHLIQWSPGFRGRAGIGDEHPDEWLAQEPVSPSDIILAQLDDHDWKPIQYFDEVGQLMAVALAGDPVPVAKFVAEQRARYAREVSHV